MENVLEDLKNFFVQEWNISKEKVTVEEVSFRETFKLDMLDLCEMFTHFEKKYDIIMTEEEWETIDSPKQLVGAIEKYLELKKVQE